MEKKDAFNILSSFVQAHSHKQFNTTFRSFRILLSQTANVIGMSASDLFFEWMTSDYKE